MPSERTLAALYRLNKTAKTYANEAAHVYQMDDGESARIASCRKTALYRFKTYVLQQWYAAGAVDRVDHHTIDDRAYYCLMIAGWQFHTPIDQWATVAEALASDDPDRIVSHPDASTVAPPGVPRQLPADEVTATTTLDDFDADSHPTATPDLAASDARAHLDSAFDASPNIFLDQAFIDVGWHRPDLRFTGWPDLSHAREPPTPPEEGDRVDEADMDDDTAVEFLFGVGDSLDTYEHGRITILDRYGIYTIPFHSQYNWTILDARYDLALDDDGTTRSNVSEEDLFGFRVLLDDPAAPADTVEGRLATHVQAIDPEYRRGDTLVFDPLAADNTTPTATVTEFAIWGTLIECRLEYDDGTTRWQAYDDIAPGIKDIRQT